MTLPPFPVDDTTLGMLEAAVSPHGDDTAPTLDSLLAMLSQMGGSDPQAVLEVFDDGGTPVEVLRDPHYHVDDALAALIGEVRRLRAQSDVEHLWDLVQQRLRYADRWTLAINPWGIYGCVTAKIEGRDGSQHLNFGTTLTKRLAWALGILPPMPTGHRDAGKAGSDD